MNTIKLKELARPVIRKADAQRYIQQQNELWEISKEAIRRDEDYLKLIDARDGWSQPQRTRLRVYGSGDQHVQTGDHQYTHIDALEDQPGYFALLTDTKLEGFDPYQKQVSFQAVLTGDQENLWIKKWEILATHTEAEVDATAREIEAIIKDLHASYKVTRFQVLDTFGEALRNAMAPTPTSKEKHQAALKEAWQGWQEETPGERAERTHFAPKRKREQALAKVETFIPRSLGPIKDAVAEVTATDGRKGKAMFADGDAWILEIQGHRVTETPYQTSQALKALSK